MSSDHRVLVLSAAEVRRLLDIDLAIESQRRAFEELGRGRAVLPARLLVDGRDDSVAFCYAARLSPDSGAVCKFGSVNPGNADRQLPTISALITVLDGDDGRPASEIVYYNSVGIGVQDAAAAVAVVEAARARGLGQSVNL